MLRAFNIFRRKNRNLSNGENLIDINWLARDEIERTINNEIIDRLKREPRDALDDMSKDITRCEYVIERCSTRAIDLDNLIKVSEESEHTRWISENIVALSFCHQGLCKVITDSLGLRYEGREILNIGLSGGNYVNGQIVNAPLIRFTFSNEGEEYFITLKVDGYMSTLSTGDDSYPANRESSKLHFGLRMQFIPEKKSQFRINRCPPKIKIQMDDNPNMYSFMFTEDD